MKRLLPKVPHLDHLKNEAKALLNAHRDGDVSVCATLRQLRRFEGAADDAILDYAQARRVVLERAVRRIRAEESPFKSADGMTYGLAAMDAYIEKMDHVPFCEPCAESAAGTDRASGWSCAQNCAVSVGSGVSASAEALSEWSAQYSLEVASHLQAASQRYRNIKSALEPFMERERNQGYHSIIGDLEKQKQHAKDVLRPIMDEFVAAADEMEKALAAME